MPSNFDDAAAGAKHDIALTQGPDEQHLAAHATELPLVLEGAGNLSVLYESESDDFPTTEELHDLRRVSDKIPWNAYTVAFVELTERFSYYGTTVVCTFSTQLGSMNVYMI